MTHDEGAGSPASSATSNTAGRRKLGEILVAGGAVTDKQLSHALTEQARLKLPLGQTLLALGYTTDETMRQALSSQLGVPYIDLQNVIIDRSLAPLLERDFAREHAVFPVARIGQTLTLAMDDPTQTFVVDDLIARSGYAVTVVTSSHDAIHRALARMYDGSAPTRAVDAGMPAPARRASSESHATTGAVPADPPPTTGEHRYVALLGLMTYDLGDLLRSIEGGLSFRAFDEFVGHTGLSEERAAECADISRRTLATRREEGRFTRDESDRLVRAARIFGGALALFAGNRQTAVAWLTSGQPDLRGAVPLDLARTDLGAREVEKVQARLAQAG